MEGTMKECPSFRVCSAPICPLNEDKSGVWFPGESVCTRDNAPAIVRHQRKIARKFDRDGRPLMEEFFTVPMLERHCVTPAHGISAETKNCDRAEREATWLRNHPETSGRRGNGEALKRWRESQKAEDDALDEVFESRGNERSYL